MSERTEALMRIVVGIISGIILEIWTILIKIVIAIQFFVVIFSNKRNKDLAEFSNTWNNQVYRYVRYMTFTTHEKPFPFSKGGLGKNKDKVELKDNSKKKK